MTRARITTHPGEILDEEFLKPMELSANALAIHLRVAPNRITTIINGDRSITPDTALRLSRYFGTTPEFWMNLQSMHDLTKAKIEVGQEIDADVRPRSV